MAETTNVIDETEADEPIANKLAKEQRAISISDFFRKNKHLLGFDNPIRALLTSVKEAVDNSLDATEEADLLPEILIQIKETSTNKFKLIVEDNGPGIVHAQMAPIFGKLLYGSKFQIIGGKQGRGQQGIGISAVILYAQETTGQPARLRSKIGPKYPAHQIELKISDKNEPIILSDIVVDWNKEHGTRVEVDLVAKYMDKKASVLEYVRETAVVNPHARIVYVDPQGEKHEFPRVTDILPKKPERIRPHPYGMELGSLDRMLKSTTARALKSFLTSEFDKVGPGTADEIIKTAEIDARILPKLLTLSQIEKLLKAMQGAKVSSPSTSCLSPIGADLLKASLQSEYKLEFAHAITRAPSVYKGTPFQVEVAIGYGGDLSVEGQATLIRFANRVPLLYKEGDCAISKAIMLTNWKAYGLAQSGKSKPTGPAIILVHVASVWVPYTSESKEAVAAYPEIIKELRLALQECGRHLSMFISKKRKSATAQRKKDIFENYSKELAAALSSITGAEKEAILKNLLIIAQDMCATGQIGEDEEEAAPEGKKRKTGAFKGLEGDEDEE